MKKKFLAAALASVMAVTSATAVSAVELGTISGDLKVEGGLVSSATDAVEMKDGESYTFKFHNKSNGDANWHNFAIFVTSAVGADYTGADQELLVVRADRYAVSPSPATDLPSWGPDGDEWNNANLWKAEVNWDNWLSDMKAGVDVEATISKDGNKFAYSAKIGNNTMSFEATSGGAALPDTVYVFLTGEQCELTGITATKTPEETEPEVPDDTKAEEPAPEVTEPEATQPEATEPEATEPEQTEEPAEPISLGDLNVTAFFGAKTNTVPLKSGDTYTFTFNAKSNGTNNWDNFIMAIADVADTAAYPENGADHEVLVIRADNWGWGGGLSDIVAPDAADGNKLAFVTNIADENADHWAEWAAMMQQGCDVTIKLTRNGNTITYNATMGDYYVNLIATSGKALPDDLYVFLTGENCDLTGITATPEAKTSTSTPKPTPDTGVAAPFAVAAVAIVSVGTLVVLKKKSK